MSQEIIIPDKKLEGSVVRPRYHSPMWGTVVSATEARVHIGCSYETLEYLVRYRGLRPVHRAGEQFYFRTNDLDEFISFGRALIAGRI